MAEHFKPADQDEQLDEAESRRQPEAGGETAKRIEELEAKGKRQAEAQPDKLAEARSEVAELAKDETPEHPGSSRPEATTNLPTAKKQAFAQTLATIRDHLPSKASARFSRFIHRPSVEKVSEVVSKTVMRPSLTLGLTAGALVGGIVFLYLAKRYGFALTGGEFVMSAALGGLIGLGAEGLGWLFKTGTKRAKS